MFTTKLSRAAPRATAALSQTSSTATSSAPARCIATGRTSHQRRHSSSKASTPPDSTASGKPAAPAAKTKATGNAGADPAAAAPVPAEKKKTGYRRAGGVTAAGKTKGKENAGVDQFAGLPSVPSLQGLENPEVQKDLSMSSFFSLHRPISLTQPFPPTVTPQTFSAIFSPARNTDPWHNGNSAERRPEDIIITLNNTIEMLERNREGAENEGVRWEVLNEQEGGGAGGVKHLDGTPQQPRIKSLDELVANFRPFRAPPPPEPFDEKYARPSAQKQQKKAASPTTKKAKTPQQKIYVTEIRVTESTHSDGRKTYAASSTPIRRLEEQQQQALSSSPSASASSPSRQVFLERVRRRTERGVRAEMASIRKPLRVKVLQGMGWRRRETWWTISVKRQRKLKMKKHKHKKLMKRTRNLRRRLGRT